MAKETEQNVHGLIFKKDDFVAFCYLRGSMAHPGNWETFKPVAFIDPSPYLGAGKYNLELLVESGSTPAPTFSITIKGLALEKARFQERTAPAAQPKSARDAIAQKVRQIRAARRPAAQTKTTSKDCGRDQELER